MSTNLLRLALKNIASRRTRSWLTILGVLVGVTAVVALLSIGTGVQEAVLQQFEDIGYDIILIAPFNTAGGRMAGAMGGTPSGGIAASGMAGRLGATGPTASGASSTGGTFSPQNLTGGNDDPSPSGSGTQTFDSQRSLGTGLDAELLLTQVPQLVEAGTLGTQIHPVDAGTTSGFLRVSTPSLEFLEAFPSVLGGFQMAEGTTFTSTTENQVVVGARTADLLEIHTGDTVDISGEVFTVVGILEARESSDEAAESEESNPLTGQGLTRSLGTSQTTNLITRGLGNTDDALFVLYERAAEVLSGREAMSVTITRVEQGASISETMDAINVAIGQQDATGTPISIQEVADEIQGTLGLIETVLASIAAVALVVGGVGLMNTMYTAVLERTREIGILKSVGARDRQVMTLFLIDSGLMGFLGGILGLVLGSVLSFFGTRLLGPSLGVGSFSPVISIGLVLGVLAFSFVLGAFSGAWPAWRASRLNPVDALAAE